MIEMLNRFRLRNEVSADELPVLKACEDPLATTRDALAHKTASPTRYPVKIGN
jgi:hypothetical protein